MVILDSKADLIILHAVIVKGRNVALQFAGAVRCVGNLPFSGECATNVDATNDYSKSITLFHSHCSINSNIKDM